MKKLVLVIGIVLTIVTMACATEITLTVPTGITEQQVKEWVSILVERKVNTELNEKAEVKAAAEAAKTEIDAYRKSVGLQPKFEEPKFEVAEEIKEL